MEIEPQFFSFARGEKVPGLFLSRIDYIISGNITIDSSTGVTLTIKPGTVIAHSAGSTTGKLLIDGTDDGDIGDAINCVGDPANGGYITWVAAGRAANTPYIGVPYSNLSTFIELESGSHYDIRFTKFLGMGFAVVVSEGNGTIRDNQFYANSRGLDLINCAGIQCQNNLFSVNNQACRVVNGSVTVRNCTFDRNTLTLNWATTGSETGSMAAVNCLFTSNTYGIRICSANGSVTDNNNGFYNNSVAHIQNNSGVAITYYGVSYAQGASIPPSSARGDIVLTGDPYDFSVVNTDGTYTDFADRLHVAQTSSIIDAGYDPDYAGMPFFTTALGHAADIPPVDMGYHYPGVVRFVDAGQILSAGEQTGQSWTTAYKYLQDALDEAAVTPITSICVAKGTYYPDEDKDNGHVNNIRTETFNLVEGMEIYGGFSDTGTENPFEVELAAQF